MNSDATAAAPVIQLRDVSKTYRTGDVEVRAVRGVTLDIARGDFVAVMGASGSGKSTLMNTLGCLDQPTGGDYRLDGVSGNVRDEQLHGVGADVDDGAARETRNAECGMRSVGGEVLRVGVHRTKH